MQKDKQQILWRNVVLETQIITMQYLSKEIETLAKKQRRQGSSLVKKEYSCGIFQEYGRDIPKETPKENDATP